MSTKLVYLIVFVKISDVISGLGEVRSGDVTIKRINSLKTDEDDYELSQRINNIYEDLTTVLSENSTKADIKTEVSISNLLDKTKALLEIFKFEKDRHNIIIKQTNNTEKNPIKIPSIKNNSHVSYLHIQIVNIPVKVVYVKNAIIIETSENADEEKIVIENDIEHDKTTFICEEHISPKFEEVVIKKTAMKEEVTEPTTIVTGSAMMTNFFPTQLPSGGSDFLDYELNDDENKLDYLTIDYVELFKDVTNEIPVTTTDMVEVEVYTHDEKPATNKVINNTGVPNGSCNGGASAQTASDVTFPWIAAIFIRNNNTNEFEYICDGAILGDRAILSAARCLGNSTADDILVLLGKRSLQKMDGNEVYRIQEIKIHSNFTMSEDNAQNDLVMLVPDKSLVYNNLIQKACMLSPQDMREEIVDSMTTGWQINGDLIDIRLTSVRDDTSCLKQPELDTVFCAAYDASKKTCPSYGGLHLVKLRSNMWYLDGILTEDTRRRGVCLHKSRRFTDLTRYDDWIKENAMKT